jgi:uncharacterized protein HemX
MTPNDKPFDSANEPDNTQANTPLSSPSSDAAALQAIEALEAESNELPESPSMAAAQPNSVTPSATPIVQTPEAPVVATPTSSTPAPDIAASLKEAPATPTSTEFQPFAGKKKSSKKPVIIVAIILLVIGLAVGGYFGWQYLQSQNNTPAPIQNIPADQTPEEDTNEPTEASLSDDITEIEAELDAIEDTEYDDETLSDETLYN